MRFVKFLFLSLIITLNGYTQCPFLGPDQYLPCGVTSTTLVADLSQCSPGSNPNQTTNYTVSQIPYVAQTNTGAFVQLSDDSQSGIFNIGFTFCFYGQTYTQFRIGSNGWVSLGPGAQPTTFTSAGIPSVAGTIPKNCIMGPWQDWNPGVGGQIRYQVQGTAPCRKLVVSWIGVPMFSCTNVQGTFHIVLYESSNYIENHIQVKPNCLVWAGGTAVQGIHDAAGLQAVTVPGRNSTQWTALNDARRWTPSGPVVTPTLTWFQVGNPVAIGTGPTITVTPPPAGANYTCQFVYPTCNAGWSSCNAGQGQGPDTVFVQPGPPQLPNPTVVSIDPNCNNGCDGSINITPNGGTGIITISWNVPGNSFNLTNLCPGVYNYNLVDAAGCTYNSSVTINNPPPLPNPQIVTQDPICYNDCNGTATVNPLGGTPPFTYLWSNNQTTQTVTNLCFGQYSVNVLDQFGCPAQAITVLNNPPQVTISAITGSDTVCFGSANDIYSVINQNGYTYLWQTIGSISTGQSTNSINVDWSSETAGFIPGAVQVTGYNQLGCPSLPSVFDLSIFLVNPQIDQLGPFCSYDPCVNLTALPTGGQFTISGQTVTQFCPQFNSSQDSVVYTYVQSGCSFTDTTSFIVNPQPFIIDILPSDEFYELCLGDSITQTYTINVNLSGTTEWTILNQTYQVPQLTYTWNQPGTYLISATETVNGCVSPIAQTTINITQCPEDLLYIPNAFTPDGDENNPVWRFYFSGQESIEFELLLFNRWGQLIWECHNVNGYWDGTYAGTYVPDGVYVWAVQYKLGDSASTKTKYGHVTVLR